MSYIWRSTSKPQYHARLSGVRKLSFADQIDFIDTTDIYDDWWPIAIALKNQFIDDSAPPLSERLSKYKWRKRQMLAMLQYDNESNIKFNAIIAQTLAQTLK